MAPQPQRRTQRKTHLDASVVPVERALLARAGELNDTVERSDTTLAPVFASMAAEFRALAEELHWW